MRQRGAPAITKRLIDLLGAATLLPAAILPLCLLLLYCWRHFKAPPVFTQSREGRNGVSFRVYKLRTMNDFRDASGSLLSDEVRLTRFGRWLRSTSLDELPQLMNIFLGDMSLVGPRPLPGSFSRQYGSLERKRLQVKPGITGWVQVNGRNRLSWDDKFELDAWYVDNWSLWLDMRILLATIPVVLFRRDIDNPGHATSAQFRGIAPSGET